MPDIAATAQDMISTMNPTLRPGVFVFVTTNQTAVINTLLPAALATFREEEGMSMLVPLDVAERSNFDISQPMHGITLNVFSSLEGVGLTAAVAAALGDHDIPCNMIAACHHDHVFVPSAMCDRAMQVLTARQNQAVLSD